MTDIEKYILKFNQDKQERLVKIRSIVAERYPTMSERIYYGVPTVKDGERYILCYAGYKDHVSIITEYAHIAFLQEKYPQYKYTRATIVFPDKEPLPEEFIKEVVGML